MLAKLVYEVFSNHRSIRRYKSDPIPDGDLEIIMESARRAPTDATLHLWSAIRVKDRDKRRRIATLIGQEHVYEAAEFFVFTADLYRLKKLLEYRGEELGNVDFALLLFAAIDAAIAAENMAIMAEALGYGICFIGGVQNAAGEIIKLLGLPHRTYPLFGLTIGVPAENPRIRPRLPRSMLFHEDEYRDYSDDELSEAYRVMSSYSGRDWLRIIKRYAGKGGYFEDRNKVIPELLKMQGFNL
ncbi:MAG: nitroreductase family protein [Desulfurococcales archaeon]|nr:nitroreductase family protein [Desulfurococcales archaeon]